MKVFLDADVLVAVLNKEYPLFNHASRLLSLGKGFTLFTSPICLAIAFYFAEKKHGSRQAKDKIRLLAEHLEIAGCGKDEVLQAAKDPKVLDFEDGMEYYSALAASCDCIITQDSEDFYFSDIEVLAVTGFLSKYALRSA
jgi:predicted nucleic acid-binding protein